MWIFPSRRLTPTQTVVGCHLLRRCVNKYKFKHDSACPEHWRHRWTLSERCCSGIRVSGFPLQSLWSCCSWTLEWFARFVWCKLQLFNSWPFSKFSFSDDKCTDHSPTVTAQIPTTSFPFAPRWDDTVTEDARIRWNTKQCWCRRVRWIAVAINAASST